jgi:hypothetical protein
MVVPVIKTGPEPVPAAGDDGAATAVVGAGLGVTGRAVSEHPATSMMIGTTALQRVLAFVIRHLSLSAATAAVALQRRILRLYSVP